MRKFQKTLRTLARRVTGKPVRPNRDKTLGRGWRKKQRRRVR